jgi:hypothetical protein
MAGLNNNGKNEMLDGLSAVAVYAALHTEDPGTTGTAEVTGGSPAYARKSISWAAAASGALTTNAQIVFDVPASTTIKYLGYWSAVTTGTFYGSRALSANETYAGQGTYTIASGDIDESVT